MIKRELKEELLQSAEGYPIVTITGPRQSGKTLLVRDTFSNFPYFNLEAPDFRLSVSDDPRSFLKQCKNGAIIDEIQNLPELLSYIQVIVDEPTFTGKFILTGSNQFSLLENINQSLAGRTAILKLLPFSFNELNKFKSKIDSFENQAFYGSYPAIFDRNILPTTYYHNYLETYIQRDIRKIINIKDLNLFTKFIKLCAGRVGSILNHNSLANDTGISVITVRNWLSILEASYIIYSLQPYFENIGKRLIKSPKLYFYDTGLLSYLLDIEKSSQIVRDPLRGAIFENMVISELIKYNYNRGVYKQLYFYRDSNGVELDIIFKCGNNLIGAEIKSSATYNKSFLKNIKKCVALFGNRLQKTFLIYNGDIKSNIQGTDILNYTSCNNILKFSQANSQ